MIFNLHYEQECDCIIGSFIGNMNLEALKEYAKEIKKTVMKNNCKHFINDLRRANLDLTSIDIFSIPSLLIKLGIDHTWKIAVVFSNDVEDYSFFETVTNNRGKIVKIFKDPDEAINWLKGW
jgi:hypothetical protein